MTDVSAALSAVPASARRTGVAPPRPAEPIAYTATEARAAPRKANHTYAVVPVSPSALIAITTAAAAPALTPSSPGSAMRVAGERLHQRAGEPERDPDGDPEQRARDPDVEHDGGVPGVAAVTEGVDDLAEGDRAGADGEAEQHGEGEHAHCQHESGAAGDRAPAEFGLSERCGDPHGFGNPNSWEARC